MYDRFRKWCLAGTWEAINESLGAVVRTEDGRDVDPSACVLDSQTVCSDSHGGVVGYDAGKKTKGRKRFILVDALGMLLGVDVLPANTPVRAGAQTLLEPLLARFRSLRNMWVEGGYRGPDFSGWLRQQSPQLHAEVTKRTDDVRGFRVLPKRWVVERTFGWLMRHRRLVRDYEKTESSAVGWILVALIRAMLGGLA